MEKRKTKKRAAQLGPLFLLSILAIAILTTGPAAHASTVTFSDYGLTSQQILIYNNTALVGEVNSTGTIAINDGENYVFVLKPMASTDFFNDPFKFVDLIKAYIPTIIVILIALFIGVGIVIIIKGLL